MCRKAFDMKKILSSSVKHVKKVFLAATLIILIDLIAMDQIELFAAVLIGYILAAFYVFSTAMRLSSVMGLSREQAKRRMLIGLIFRLVMLLVVLLAALKISQKVFFAMVLGFLTFYCIAQLGLIITSYKMVGKNNSEF